MRNLKQYPVTPKEVKDVLDEIAQGVVQSGQFADRRLTVMTALTQFIAKHEELFGEFMFDFNVRGGKPESETQSNNGVDLRKLQHLILHEQFMRSVLNTSDIPSESKECMDFAANLAETVAANIIAEKLPRQMMIMSKMINGQATEDERFYFIDIVHQQLRDAGYYGNTTVLLGSVLTDLGYQIATWQDCFGRVFVRLRRHDVEIQKSWRFESNLQNLLEHDDIKNAVAAAKADAKQHIDEWL